MRNRKSSPAAIVLLSGGLDSAVTLYTAKKAGLKCFCLIFDYGQRHRKEISCAKKIAKRAGCDWQIAKISLPWRGSSLLERETSVPGYTKRRRGIPSTYVPGRNIIFLSFAASFAEASAASGIYIGAHAQDYSGYPDCRPEFFRAFNRAIVSGTKAGAEKRIIKVVTPLIDKTKAEIIKAGICHGVPFELTWSCYRGGNSPCGKCDSCHFRAKGFEEAGLRDPLIKSEA